jgi:hypothetical protein
MAVEGSEVIAITPEQFEAGVAMAAQQVAQVHRRRLVLYGFLAGMLSTAIIALPTEYVVGRSNCDSITSLADAQEEGFTEGIKSRGLFLAQSKDRLGLSERQFQALLRRSDESQRKQLAAIQNVKRTDCTFR